MFDATKGQQAADTRLDNLSDQLAADAIVFLHDPGVPRAQKEAALEAAAAIFADPSQLSQLAQGTYAQGQRSATGQPIAALGAGQSTMNAQEGLQAILGDTSVDPGIKLALRRLLTPADPQHIPVGRDGTPSELAATRHERDEARTALANERDAGRNGSLAKQLTDVTAERDAARNADGYDQTAASAKLRELLTAINAQRGRVGGRIEGTNEVKVALTDLCRAVNLQLSP